MEEKIIIKGNAESVKLIPTILIALGLFVGVGISWWITVPYSEEYMLPVTISGGAILIVMGIVMMFYVNSCEICVTNKRIYGKASFGTRVDIPIDSVSAVGTIGWLKGISVASSSGAIKFLYIENSSEIHSAISKIIIARQKQGTNVTTNITQEQSSADELKKFKDLLDSGIITQEEFDAKKKQLLGL